MNHLLQQNRWPLVTMFFGAFLLLFFSKEHFLFWDTVQFGAAHPSYYFSTNFSSFWLPSDLDSGHPPFFGIYIAWCWKLFGKTLKVTHIAMWPIAFGIIWQLWRLAQSLFPKYAGWILVVVCLEPVLLGQFILVSPDLVVVFAFFLAINAILKDRRLFLILAIILLGMISTRGMMLAFAVFIWSWWKDGSIVAKDFGLIWKKFWPFIPGGLIGLLFLVAHYQAFGWVGYHEGSSWAASFERVGWSGLLRNVVIVFIHLLDFGHVFMLLILAWTSFKYKSVLHRDTFFRQFILLIFCLGIFLLPSLIIHKYLFNHRYLLPLFLALDGLTIYAVVKFWTKPKIGFIISAVLLALGSFWIYPQPIATSWDGTVMHWGYYESRKDLMEYIDEAKIPMDQIGTAFPNINSPSMIDLSLGEDSFVPVDLNVQDYVFYSNVMNDFSGEELLRLEEEFDVEKEIWSGMVVCRLYRRGAGF